MLRGIQRDGSIPLSRLAEYLVMDRTSLYRTLTPLEKSGLIKIVNGDGRAKIASLTAAGRRATAQARERWEVAQRRLVETFGVERWTALHEGLAALTAAGIAANE